MERCPNCPGTHNCVPGDGPCDSKYLFLGEAPGREEDRKLQPFIGKTGSEVNRHYLPLVGLRREGVRFDNAIHCLPPKDGKLDSKRQGDLDLLSSCSEHHLLPTLERNPPKLIVPMGVFACRAIDPTIDLELQHGLPVKTAWGMAFPMYHPAGGIHEPKKMLQIRTDWTRLRKYMIGKLPIPQDSYKGQEIYEEITSPSHLKVVLGRDYDIPMGCDTEVKRGGDPFCLTFSTQAGTGFLIRAERHDLLSLFQEYLDKWIGPILFHNWLFDSVVVSRMKLRFPPKKIVDTMVVVFHLGNLPQGLKALSYRELGMKMQDFDDLVTPYSAPKVLDYYRDMFAEDWPTPEPEMVRNGDGKWKLYKPQGLNTKLKRFFHDLNKSPDKDLFQSWTNWESCHEMVEDVCGKWPGKCISHVPFDKALYYACRDSDALVRLWPLLKHMRTKVRRRPQEHWGEGWSQ